MPLSRVLIGELEQREEYERVPQRLCNLDNRCMKARTLCETKTAAVGHTEVVDNPGQCAIDRQVPARSGLRSSILRSRCRPDSQACSSPCIYLVAVIISHTIIYCMIYRWRASQRTPSRCQANNLSTFLACLVFSKRLLGMPVSYNRREAQSQRTVFYLSTG